HHDRARLQAESDFARPVVLFGLIGQSNADGVNCRYRDVDDPGMPASGEFPGCYIFDKVARKGRLDVNLPSEVRALTPGYANGALKPWSDPSNDFFGPELSFCLDYQRKTGHTVIVVKLAIGGSRVGNGEYFNWNVDGHEKYSLLDAYLRGYWGPTLKWLDGRAKDVRVGGMISMVGASDARTKSDAEAYAGHMADIIRVTREFVRPKNGPNVPWLVIKTPRITRDGIPIGFLDEIRKSQDRMDALPGVKVQDLDLPSFHPNDKIHLNPKGEIALGRQIATWASQVV
ncbi:MAG: sialate O-acetylesterase, partial [Planctomycetota bacterium]|nr:sialate O-acetylesterase [Planctomycetota bacterium]